MAATIGLLEQTYYNHIKTKGFYKRLSNSKIQMAKADRSAETRSAQLRGSQE